MNRRRCCGATAVISGRSHSRGLTRLPAFPHGAGGTYGTNLVTRFPLGSTTVIPAKAVPAGTGVSAMNGGVRSVWADNTCLAESVRKNATCVAVLLGSGTLSRTRMPDEIRLDDTSSESGSDTL